jgi:hypothetical protein
MTTRIAITSSLFLGILLLPCSMASAQVTGACVNDVQAHCAGVQPGGGRIKECIKGHLKDLSEGCQAVVLKAATAKVCEADVKDKCAGIEPGEGRIEACMKMHVADISDACKVGLANAAAGED